MWRTENLTIMSSYEALTVVPDMLIRRRYVASGRRYPTLSISDRRRDRVISSVNTAKAKRQNEFDSVILIGTPRP